MFYVNCSAVTERSKKKKKAKGCVLTSFRLRLYLIAILMPTPMAIMRLVRYALLLSVFKRHSYTVSMPVYRRQT